MNGRNDTFMGKYSALVYASVLAAVLGGFLIWKIEGQKKAFYSAVRAAREVSDQQFIDMVYKLEDLLAERASFGYAGSRDPMTGAVRAVAARPAAVPKAAAERMAATERRAPAPAAPAEESGEAPGQAAERPDHVRLTAIIYDNTKRIYTAVVMDGGRSLSVDVGDRVADRRVTRITNNEIHMESDTERFIYNILGDNARSAK
jgi:hypothetical protein